MESVQSLYRNQFIRAYFNSSELSVIPWVLDPNGLSHPLVFGFELNGGG